MSPTELIRNTVKVRMENIAAIVAVLLVLYAAMMDPYASVGIAVTLLVVLGIYRFAKLQEQEKACLDG